MVDYNEYADLEGASVSTRVPVPPEQEFFHSVYISGKSRKNHINVIEKVGLLQIRGVEYNLEEVNFIITHTKNILSRTMTISGKDSLTCFSYQSGEWPWKGTSKDEHGNIRTCGKTSPERAADPWCKDCRSQILLAGMYCDANGRPHRNENKNPVFIFLRGKGIKYNAVSELLNEYSRLELDSIFDTVTEESKKFEKSSVNNKRYVTKVKVGYTDTKYGQHSNFVFERGPELPKNAVLEVLKMSKKTLDKFREKFDWSKINQAASTGYGDVKKQEVSEDQKFEDSPAIVKSEPEKKTEVVQSQAKVGSEAFSFDDIEF